jgi:hypothetical protein
VELASPTTLDPNRDFPMLRRGRECMNTITARTVNEIFINNLIRFSLSIHGGTSSLTYAWGTPNHLTHLKPEHKINKKTDNPKILESFYQGKFDEIDNESTESPDNTGLQSM